VAGRRLRGKLQEKETERQGINQIFTFLLKKKKKEKKKEAASNSSICRYLASNRHLREKGGKNLKRIKLLHRNNESFWKTWKMPAFY